MKIEKTSKAAPPRRTRGFVQGFNSKDIYSFSKKAICLAGLMCILSGCSVPTRELSEAQKAIRSEYIQELIAFRQRICPLYVNDSKTLQDCLRGVDVNLPISAATRSFKQNFVRQKTAALTRPDRESTSSNERVQRSHPAGGPASLETDGETRNAALEDPTVTPRPAQNFATRRQNAQNLQVAFDDCRYLSSNGKAGAVRCLRLISAMNQMKFEDLHKKSCPEFGRTIQYHTGRDAIECDILAEGILALSGRYPLWHFCEYRDHTLENWLNWVRPRLTRISHQV